MNKPFDYKKLFLFQPGDKVKDSLSGEIFRVKARFVTGFGWHERDNITLENVETRQGHTVDYFNIVDNLSLVCHPITNAIKI